MPKLKDVRSSILRALTSKPGQPVFMNELMEAVASANGGATPTAPTIQSAVSHLMELHPIEVMVRGRAWQYMPNKKKEQPQPTERLFREVGPIQDGSLILQGDDQSIWKATRL